MTSSKAHAPDKSLIVLVVSFLLFGLVMIYAATAVSSFESLGNAYKMVVSQFMWIVAGLIGFLSFVKIPYEKLSNIALRFFLLSLFLLILLAFTSLLFSCSRNEGVLGFVYCKNGARRWLYLNPDPLPEIPFIGVLGIQPSEMAKLAFVIFLAVLINKHISSGYLAFVVYAVLTGVSMLLIAVQPNLSTALMFGIIGTSIYIASGANLFPLFVGAPFVGLFGWLSIAFSDYRRSRLMTFLGLSAENEGAGYHIKQVLIALGSGGLFGVGLGQSKQKFMYVPEIAGDSIFAIIGEELGFVGTALVIILFLLLLLRCFNIAKRAPDLLGRMLCVGVTSWIGFQFFVNTYAMARLIPLTGVPLPLISYGGSSMVFSLMGLGIIANVSKHAK